MLHRQRSRHRRRLEHLSSRPSVRSSGYDVHGPLVRSAVDIGIADSDMHGPSIRSVPDFGDPGAEIYAQTSILVNMIRWRHMIRNVTIRNRDSHRLIFLNFLLRVKELVTSDCRFEFCMKNCIYSKLEMFRILEFDPTMRNAQTLTPNNAISHHTSPP